MGRLSLRDFVAKLDERKMLLKHKEPLELEGGLTPYLKAGPQAQLFENVLGHADFKVAGNLLTTREHLALALGCEPSELLRRISSAIDKPGELLPLTRGACFEVESSLDKLPVPRYFLSDGGPYISSAVVITSDPEHGPNMSFHRIMLRPDGTLAMRLVPNRHTWEYYRRSGGSLEAAICIGADPAVLLAGAVCTDLGKYELPIASAIAGKPVETVRCNKVDLSVPGDTEIVIEARFTPEFVNEGPFVDITLTPDIVRKEPKVEVLSVTHRRSPIFHALLPGGHEHSTVWKTPTEAVMFREVGKACKCSDVFLSFGGCSRFHGIVQIKKEDPGDARRAIDAALQAHKSMKHVFVVDEDIDVQDPNAVEWALATRFQAKTDLVVLHDQHGSTLDPSTQKTGKTSKLGFDCTVKGKAEEFRKVF